MQVRDFFNYEEVTLGNLSFFSFLLSYFSLFCFFPPLVKISRAGRLGLELEKLPVRIALIRHSSTALRHFPRARSAIWASARWQVWYSTFF